jgi:hypothetical protein
VTAHRYTHTDPDAGIPDLIRRLTEDSRRLAGDEVRLAKLELNDSLHTGTRGVVWSAIGLAVGIVAMVALTVVLIAGIGAVAGHNYWAGALIVGAIELVAGWLFLRRGIAAIKAPRLTAQKRAAHI